MINHKFLGLNKGFWWRQGNGVPFNPLTDPDLQAVYYINRTTMTPKGGIEPLLTGSDWLEQRDLVTGGAKRLGSSVTFTTESSPTPSGLYPYLVYTSNAVLVDDTISIMTGITNWTIMIPFKKGTSTDQYNMLHQCRDSSLTHSFFVVMESLNVAVGNRGKIRVNFTGGANTMEATSAVQYNDDQWHILVAVVDQINKELTVYIDNEKFSASNANLVAKVMTPSATSHFYMGRWSGTTGERWVNGNYGDIVILNKAVNQSKAIEMMAWEKKRLGI